MVIIKRKKTRQSALFHTVFIGFIYVCFMRFVNMLPILLYYVWRIHSVKPHVFVLFSYQYRMVDGPNCLL